MEMDKLKDCIREVLAERSTVDPEIHREHHQFLTECAPLLREFLAYRAVRLEQKRRWDERWRKMQDSAIGAVTIAAVGGTFAGLAWVGRLVITAMQSGSVGSGH